MFLAFLLALRQGLRLLWWSIIHLFTVDLRAFPKRLLLFSVGVPLFIGLQTAHWFGFLLDELLFRGYRQIVIDRPVFIVGIPRSGTTFLQRTLAQDERLTTTKMWECFLAPSVTERLIYRGIGRLFAPLGRLLPGRSLKFFNEMKGIHELGLQESEEDFLLLLPIYSCFILIAVFPEAEWLWKLAYFDHRLSAREKETIMDFYRRCIQKHLYVHGPQRRYLSKNPSFSSLLQALTHTFPDCKLIVTVREPAATVPSQLSSLRPALALVGTGTVSAPLQKRIVAMLHHYYQYFGEYLPQFAPHTPVLANHQLKNDLKQCLTEIYNHIELPLLADFARVGDKMAHASAQHKSQHRYQLADFDVTEAFIKEQFGDVWPLPRPTLDRQRTEKTQERERRQPAV